MIPKIIHYCWFGGKPIPVRLRRCMESWKEIMPEWEYQCWDECKIDINSIPWIQEAYAAGKYAFVSDYVRLVALYEVGGVYLDTDVELLKSLNPLVDKYDAFMGFESETKLTSAVIAATPKHPLIKQFLEHYYNKHFSDDIVNNNEANVLMMTDICKTYGLRDNNTEQDICILFSDYSPCVLHVFPKTYFCPLDFWHNKEITEDSYTIHYFDASWLDKKTKDRILHERSVWYKATIAVKSVLSKILTLIKR